MLAVRGERLSKRFGSTRALDGVDLAVQPGELFTLLGPSGCGKTTLLRLLAGLEQATEGRLYFDGRRVDTEPVHRRNVGMVFQSYALFPHLSVGENIRYGLKARGGLSSAEIDRRAAEALAMVGLDGSADRQPGQFSGGQQQRVALARALVTRPALLLMDEPLSNLDARLRVSMRTEVRRLVKEASITTIYVTHDQEEALAISDRIGVMAAGRLVQVGTPYEVYRYPAYRQVATFVGACSFLEGRLAGGTLQVGTGVVAWPKPRAGAAGPYEGDVTVGIRPHAALVRALGQGAEVGSSAPGGQGAEAGRGAPAGSAALAVPSASGGQGGGVPRAPLGQAGQGAAVLLEGEVVAESFLGSFTQVEVRLDGGGRVEASSSLPPGSLRPGDRVIVQVDRAELLLFAAGSGEALR